MRREKNPDGTERQKSVSFRILEIKRKHYEDKNLISIAMKVDDDEYKGSFLVNNFNVIFFPEFKELDKYSGMGGFKFMHNFLIGVSSKVKYFSEIHLKESPNFETDEEEWWMSSSNSDADEIFNDWISKNEDYLSQQDLEGFDNDMIDEVVKYFKKREKFIKPEFEKDEVSLSQMLEEAIKTEDYEKAIKIREQLKKQ